MAVSFRIASDNEKESARNLVVSTFIKHGHFVDETNYLNLISHFIENTVTILAEDQNHLVGTVSLILDKMKRLPIDTVCHEEIEELRTEGHTLCEMSQFVVVSDDLETSLQLYRYAKIVALDIFNLSDIVSSAYYKYRSFYIKILRFVSLTENLPYPTIETVTVAPIRLDLLTICDLYRSISRKGGYWDLYDFFFGSDIEGIAQSLRPQINSSLLSYYDR